MLRVVKIGGSLLATPGGVEAVRRWLDEHRAAGQTRLLIAGGGPAVDGLRAIDRANPLPTSDSHWAAVRMMDANTRLLPAWLPGLPLVDARDLSTSPPERDAAVVLGDWLRDIEGGLSGARLEAGWQTTSDSIAARLAGAVGAGLCLLKRCNSGVYASAESLAEAGVVDPEFPRVAAELPSLQVIGFGFGEIGQGMTGAASTFSLFLRGKA